MNVFNPLFLVFSPTSLQLNNLSALPTPLVGVVTNKFSHSNTSPSTVLAAEASNQIRKAQQHCSLFPQALSVNKKCPYIEICKCTSINSK
ncbi:MAG: hypothetical protein ACI9C9_001305 [Marivirga sp.]|jgi:hypothetical protein